MGQRRKFLQKLLSGESDTSIPFEVLRRFLLSEGFQIRIRGDHFIFTRPDIEEIINLQPAGPLAKPYQVRQVRSILVKYHFGGV